MGKVLVWTTLTTFLLSLFQAIVLSGLVFLPAVPDLVLLVVLYVSFMNSSVIGSTSGFISGLLLDFLSAAPIGLNAFIKSSTGFLVGNLTGMFNLNKVFIPCFMAACATLYKAILVWILSLFFGPGVLVYVLYGKMLYAEMLVNVLFAPVIFGFLSVFSSLFISRDRYNENK